MTVHPEHAILPSIDADRALATLAAMVQFDTRTETPQESAVVEWVRQQMDDLGLDTYLVRSMPTGSTRLGSGGDPVTGLR